MAPTSALIIGSGIAGTAAAMALQKAGIESVVYEAYPTSAEGIGAFLTLATNGVDALRTLGADQPAIAAASRLTRSSCGVAPASAWVRRGERDPRGWHHRLHHKARRPVRRHERPGGGARHPIEHGKRLVAAEPVEVACGRASPME